MASKHYAYAATALAGFVIALLLFGSHSSQQDNVRERTVIRTRADTVREFVQVPIGRVHVNARAHHHYNNRDTLCATLDTLIRADTSAIAPDTLHIAYCRPTDRFDLAIAFSERRKPVSIPVLLHDTLIERSEALLTDRAKPWYEQALLVIGAAATGYLVGKIK